MDWKLGRWIECENTQEKGVIVAYKGRAVQIYLGDGLTLYATPQALERLGWKLSSTGERKEI